MSTQPILRTERLALRPFVSSDASEVQRMAGDRAVAERIPVIPHPYEDGMAEAWIASHPESFEKRAAVSFAITDAATGTLLGAISLSCFDHAAKVAEMGYWLGREHWGSGFATEAARAVLAYGFDELDLNRIHATHMGSNVASGRVLQKIGMQHEGCQRQHRERFGEIHDIMMYGALRPAKD